MQPIANIIARGEREIGALTDALDDVDAGRDLAARPELDLVTQPDADEGVVDEHQALGQRHADVVPRIRPDRRPSRPPNRRR